MLVIFVRRRLPDEKISKSIREFILEKNHLLVGIRIAKRNSRIRQIESSTNEATRTTNTNVRAAISSVSHRKPFQNITRKHTEQNFQRNRHHISFMRQSPPRKFKRQQLYWNFTRLKKPQVRRQFVTKQAQ